MTGKECVDFIISSGAEDWCAQMGDGSIIPLSNPTVLYHNRDNAIVEFDMSTEYAANSPCSLVYGSDTASFTVKEYFGTPREFTQNTLSGHFAFTTEGYNGGVYENGLVDRLIVTVPFPMQFTEDIEFLISSGDDHWGARMGDGSIINLKNPEVISTNNDNATIKFDMDTPYPSNSPCIVLYRSEDAMFKLQFRTTPKEFVPVTNITGVPTSLYSGETINLSFCKVLPQNATMQGIAWNIVSGNAIVDSDVLVINKSGEDVVLQATIINGSGDNKNFTKQFRITVNQNIITIINQPIQKIE